jgi:hypothetical protein
LHRSAAMSTSLRSTFLRRTSRACGDTAPSCVSLLRSRNGQRSYFRP